jgi:hypothetical protein
MFEQCKDKAKKTIGQKKKRVDEITALLCLAIWPGWFALWPGKNKPKGDEHDRYIGVSPLPTPD